ncbi:MAG: response regulator [Anaerolineales bacterium]|nr:response regulator [Anaerolineales bacterium]
MATSGEHIFVVENNPDISDLISRQALQPLGYQVTVVKDGSSALKQAIQTPPDLLIANLNLPGLNAKDLLVALASQGMNAPLIVIGKKGQEEDILQAFRVGAADYLHWPARDAEVVSVVERVLRWTHEGHVRARLDRQLKDLNAELQRKVNELTAIVAIGKAVVSITDQHRLFTKIVEGAMQASEADLGWLMLREEASKVFMLTAHCNLPDSWARKLRQPLEDGISSLVSLSGETLLIHGKPLERFKVSALGRSAAVVPIKVHNEVIGLLLVVRKQARPFDRAEQTLLEAVADYASISLVNARLFRALEQTAESAKSGERRQNALLESVREAVRGELEVVKAPIELLLGQKTSPLTEEQRQALQAAQMAMRRLVRATEKTVPPVTPMVKKR